MKLCTLIKQACKDFYEKKRIVVKKRQPFFRQSLCDSGAELISIKFGIVLCSSITTKLLDRLWLLPWLVPNT